MIAIRHGQSVSLVSAVDVLRVAFDDFSICEKTQTESHTPDALGQIKSVVAGPKPDDDLQRQVTSPGKQRAFHASGGVDGDTRPGQNSPLNSDCLLDNCR